MKRKNTESEEEVQRPLKMRPSLWQQHLKNFAQSKGIGCNEKVMDTIFEHNQYFLAAGKEAMDDNPGRFNKEASKIYRELKDNERECLRAQIAVPKQMTNGKSIGEGPKSLKKSKSRCVLTIEVV